MLNNKSKNILLFNKLMSSHIIPYDKDNIKSSSSFSRSYSKTECDGNKCIRTTYEQYTDENGKIITKENQYKIDLKDLKKEYLVCD